MIKDITTLVVIRPQSTATTICRQILLHRSMLQHKV